MAADGTRVLMLSSCTHYAGVLQWNDMQVWGSGGVDCCSGSVCRYEGRCGVIQWHGVNGMQVWDEVWSYAAPHPYKLAYAV